VVDTELKNCPKCGNPSTSLIDIDNAKRAILAQSNVGDVESLPSQMCNNCYRDLTGSVSGGAKLRLEQSAREKNKHIMWKSRVELIKKGRLFMQQKAYAEAAVTYEKYLRVLELCYDLKPGELRPDIFGKSSRSKEMTVIATTFWDLMRIYDSSPNYREKMVGAATKLAAFLPFCPIFPDVTEKARQFQDRAKNPDVVRGFLKQVKANSRRCFIATAAYENPDHPSVEILRQFRDQYLFKSSLGFRFVNFYYEYSPRLADFLDKSPKSRIATRKLLNLIAKFLHKKLEH
jgi:hypothetical protein